MVRRSSLFVKSYPENGEQSKYLLVFKHNVENGEFFESIEDFNYSNKVNKYSIMGLIDDDFKNNESYFEFRLEYPENGTFGHWIQPKHPLATPPGDNESFHEIESNWTPDEYIDFIGLHQSHRPEKTILEGVDHNATNTADKVQEWYFAIGQTKGWDDFNIIPAFTRNQTFQFHEVLLWLKITNLDVLNKIKPIEITCEQEKTPISLTYSLITLVFTHKYK